MSQYQNYKTKLAGFPFPYACLDKENLQKNIAHHLQRAGQKRIRIASKSIRCVEVMKMVLSYHDQYEGIMTYHGKEVLFLAQEGFDNFLMGYPIMDKSLLKEIGAIIKSGSYVCFMVDHPLHVDVLEMVGKELGVQMPICIDIDLSDDYPGIHFGVWRSQIQDLSSLEKILDHVQPKEHVRLDGIMGYEAQVAGVGDKTQGAGLKNNVIRFLKKKAIPKIKKRRQEAVEMVQSKGFTLRFVNGGGTGSLESTAQENVVTEVTVGSGFYQSHLFDNYTNYSAEPALFYGVQIVRKPTDQIYTCHGGGFIASGGIDKTKAPQVFLPKYGKLDALEGAGEVQTPVRFNPLTEDLDIGDPIYFRHAKSGELCERFNSLIVLDKTETKLIPTYRGQGCSFG